METAFKVFWTLIFVGATTFVWLDWRVKEPTRISTALIVSAACLGWAIDQWFKHG